MWKVIVKHEDTEDIELQFDARPAVSEGQSMVRVYSEDAGELWLPARKVEEIRVRQSNVKALEESGL